MEITGVVGVSITAKNRVQSPTSVGEGEVAGFAQVLEKTYKIFSVFFCSGVSVTSKEGNRSLYIKPLGDGGPSRTAETFSKERVSVRGKKGRVWMRPWGGAG